MPRKLDGRLLALKNKVMAMGELTQAMLGDAIRALAEHNEAFIRKVFEREAELDALQLEIDSEAIRLIVIHSPVSFDLRLILTVMRINTELERVGDHCVNICENVHLLLAEPPAKPLLDLLKMAAVAGRMVRLSLQSFVHGSADTALAVIETDDEIDALNDQVFRKLLCCMLADPRTVMISLPRLLLSGNVERIADHATNISEEVIYLMKDRDIRHRHGTSKDDARTRASP